MNQIRHLFQSLSRGQRVSILVIALALSVGVFSLVRWQQEKGFETLYRELSAEDAAAVVAKLKEKGSDYRLSSNGATISVPSARAAEMRLEMASVGLPRSGRPGFELFDKMNFGVTDFAEQVNFRRALEGELERSVMALAEVEKARVHLTFKKDSVYLESRQPAKASVLLKLRGSARLNPQSVQAITFLIASAVEGLGPEAVSVLDMQGTLLNRPRKGLSDESGQDGEAAFEYRQKLEKDLLAKIEATLEPLLGPDHFRAGVSVECDFSSGEESEELFDPNRSVMTSSQKSEDSTAASGAAAGVPGTQSSLPRPTSIPTRALGGVSRRTENVAYQTSRTVRHKKIPQGAVRRISVSILLDQDLQWQEEGKVRKRLLVPPAPEKVKSIRDLVAGTIGFSESRGDQIIVETLPFEMTLHAEPHDGPSADVPARPPDAKPTTWQGLLRDPKPLVPPLSAIMLVLLVLFVGYWQFKKGAFRRRSPTLAQVNSAPSTLAAGADAAALTAPASASVAAIEAAPQDRVRNLRELIAAEPQRGAAVLKQWIATEEE
jgi:flagellar M-ring protein FliF